MNHTGTRSCRPAPAGTRGTGGGGRGVSGHRRVTLGSESPSQRAHRRRQSSARVLGCGRCDARSTTTRSTRRRAAARGRRPPAALLGGRHQRRLRRRRARGSCSPSRRSAARGRAWWPTWRRASPAGSASPSATPSARSARTRGPDGGAETRCQAASTMADPSFSSGRTMTSHPDLASEQAHIDRAYDRLEATREEATRLRSMVEVGRGGTEQARWEREMIEGNIANGWRRCSWATPASCSAGSTAPRPRAATPSTSVAWPWPTRTASPWWSTGGRPWPSPSTGPPAGPHGTGAPTALRHPGPAAARHRGRALRRVGRAARRGRWRSTTTAARSGARAPSSPPWRRPAPAG